MRIKLLILSIIVSAGFSFAADAVLFGNMLETDWILTPEGVTNAILATASTAESDPLAYPVATNALALAEGALQFEADTLATVTARGATTPLKIGVGGLEVGHGALAEGLASVAIGTGAIASGYESFAHGAVSQAVGVNSHAQGSYNIAYGVSSYAGGDSSASTGNYSRATGFKAVALDDYSSVWQGSVGGFPPPEPEYLSHGPGTFNINPVGGLEGFYIGETPLSTTLSGYALAGAVAAVQAEVVGKADAETVVSGAVGVATAGNRYFWTSATNVVLSVGLTGGQVINYAALRNTGATAITATASTSGWKWTGGSMTNTIPAGKMMTFGWSCDPTTGNTNAYATAASEN